MSKDIREDEFGGRPIEQELIVRLHATKEDIPKGDVVIDATAPPESVADAILEQCKLASIGRIDAA